MAVEPAEATSEDTVDPAADDIDPASDDAVTGDAGVTDAEPAGDEPATDEPIAVPPADADPAPIDVVDGAVEDASASPAATVETAAPAPDTEPVTAAAVLTSEVAPVVLETLAMTDLQASAPFAVSDLVSIEGSVTFAADESGTAEIATGTVINVDAAAAVGAEAWSPRLRFVTTSASTLVRKGAGAGATFALEARGEVSMVNVRGASASSRSASLRFDSTVDDLGGGVASVLTEVAATAVDISVGDQLLSATNALFTRFVTGAGDAGFAVALDGVSFALGAGAGTVVAVSGASGVVLFTTLGAAGVLSGDAAIGSDARSFAAVASVNSTGSAVSEQIADRSVVLDPGTYFRVAVAVPGATPARFGALRLSGSLTFEVLAGVLHVTIAGGRAEIGALILDAAAVALAWQGSGYTGTIAGTAATVVGDARIGGSLTLAVGGDGLASGSGDLSIHVAGYEIDGAASVDVAADGATTVALADGHVDVGAFRLTFPRALFSIGPMGLTGAILGAAVAVSGGGLTLAGTATVTVTAARRAAGRSRRRDRPAVGVPRRRRCRRPRRCRPTAATRAVTRPSGHRDPPRARVPHGCRLPGRSRFGRDPHRTRRRRDRRHIHRPFPRRSRLAGRSDVLVRPARADRCRVRRLVAPPRRRRPCRRRVRTRRRPHRRRRRHDDAPSRGGRPPARHHRWRRG